MTGPDRHQVNYGYDTYGRLIALTDASGKLISSYKYDDAGQLVRTLKGNGTYSTYEYDRSGQLLHVVNYGPGGAVNSFFDFTYDVLGRRTSMTLLQGCWDYAYDALGQLTRAVFASTDVSVIQNQVPVGDDRRSCNGVVTLSRRQSRLRRNSVTLHSASGTDDGNIPTNANRKFGYLGCNADLSMCCYHCAI